MPSQTVTKKAASPAVTKKAASPAVTKKAASPAVTKKAASPVRLTEAALKKMPASQYMNEQQLAFFRQRLVDMRNELLENAGSTSEHLREHTAEPDPADQATIEEENALELRARDRERKLLKKIEEALRRIDDESYGFCEETGEPIGILRLLARPTATLTIDAQTRREQRQKLYGD